MCILSNVFYTVYTGRSNVFDVGPTLYNCYTNVLCLLGLGHADIEIHIFSLCFLYSVVDRLRKGSKYPALPSSISAVLTSLRSTRHVVWTQQQSISFPSMVVFQLLVSSRLNTHCQYYSVAVITTILTIISGSCLYQQWSLILDHPGISGHASLPACKPNPVITTVAIQPPGKYFRTSYDKS